jgi:hypothetical protein
MTAEPVPRVAFSLLRYPQNGGDRRAAERAAAILAAKRAAVRLNSSWELEALEIVRRENAAPLLRVGGLQVGVRVSVAHSDGLAVAAVTSRQRL